MTTFQITEFKKHAFEQKMNKFIKRAMKLGLPFGYNLVDTSEAFYTKDDKKFYYTVYNYIVFGDSPTINGFSFLAKIEPFEGENLIHTYLDTHNLESYRTAQLTCEHCHVNRFRNFYYLIIEDATDIIKMVGHNCLANYIDLPNAEAIAQFYADFIAGDFEDNEESFSERTNHGKAFFPVSQFLAYAVHNVAKRGYVSVKNESIDRSSTKSSVLSDYFYEMNDDKPTENELAQAEVIMETVKDSLNTKASLNDYERNVLILIEANRMTTAHAGYIVSLIPLYNKITEATFENSDKKVSSHIGVVGEKIENISATLTLYTNFPSPFGGTCHSYTFVTQEGNVISWLSSKMVDVEVDQPVHIIKATVKKHSQYNEVKKTEVKLVKLVKI